MKLKSIFSIVAILGLVTITVTATAFSPRHSSTEATSIHAVIPAADSAVADYNYVASPAEAPASVNSGSALFQTLTPTTSGSNKALTLNCWNIDRANYYFATNDSTTITLSKVKQGGDYRLLVKKTTSGVVTLTISGVVVATSPISLSGANNSYFWIDFTSLPGSVVALHKR